ncbi:hypothetical protein AB0D57_31220 [Streptomyces sp. NPDC048275]|uniref:hypothetical protein n=1 Tax=Streptomyces sp. NPDC048275 TaxID=3155629 RepID=UPI0033E06C41
MKTRWHGISRRRGLLTAGAVAALLASGGVAAAASGQGGAAQNNGVTLSPVPGNPHPHHVEPGQDVQLTEVPGAEPHDVRPGTAVPVDGTTVVGDEDVTQARP